MKYLEPINLAEFLHGECKVGSLDNNNFEFAAGKLTEHLLRIQQKSTPITLNSIVSACILQEEAETMEVSKLLTKANTLYEYISVKESVTTYMQVKPPKLLVEKHVDGLGFPLVDRGEKNAKILLKSKEKNL